MSNIDKLNTLKNKLELIAKRIDDLKTDVRELSDCIETRRLIPDDTSDRVIDALKELNELNESFKALYREVGVKEDIPNRIEDIEALIAKAISEFELDNKLSAYKTFLKLYSDDSMIMELLNARKKELKNLLDNYSSENEEKLMPYGLFVEAIAETNPAKLISYVSSLTPVFGNDLVGAALITRNIHVSEQEPIVVEMTETTVTDVAETVVSDTAKDEEVVEQITAKEEPDAPVVQATEDSGSNEKSRLNELFPNNIIERFDDAAEKKRTGTKIFINDMRQRNVPSNVTVMSAVDDFGAVNIEMIATATTAPFSLIAESIQYLYKKGYLREYGVDNVGTYYCASPKGIRALMAKDARGFLRLKGSYNILVKETYTVTLGSVLSRLALTKMITAFFSKGNTEYVVYRNLVYSERFYTVMRNKETQSRFVFSGVFSDPKPDLGDFFEGAKSVLDDKDEFYIIAGADHDFAKGNAEDYIRELGLQVDKVYCYSVIDGELSRYSDDETVSFSVFDDSESIPVETRIEPLIDNPVAAQTIEKTTNENEDNIICEDASSETAVVEEIVEEKPDDTILKTENSTNSEIINNVYRMIIDEKLYCATTYLRSLSDDSVDIGILYEQLAYAVNAPWQKCSYSSHKVFQLYTVGQDAFTDCMFVASSLRNFFLNHISYDYEIKALQESVKKTERISTNVALMNAIYKIASFKEEFHKGMDCYADYRVKDQVTVNKKLESLKSDAKSLYDNYINGQPKNNKGVKRFVETWKRIFSDSGDFATFLKMIIDKDTDCISLIKDSISTTFIIDGCSVEFSNLDMNKLNTFIDDNWSSTFATTAGSRYKTSNLMSDLRNNLINAVEKVLKLICEWIVVADEVSTNNDDGSARYWKERTELIAELESAIAWFKQNVSSSDEERAGMMVLQITVDEVLNRLKGTYSENYHKYFYIDFLRGNYVWLDDDYLPDTYGQSIDLQDLSLTNRILAHSKSELMSFEEKLDYIFNKHGDDYGSAVLIMNYLKETHPDVDVSQYDLKTSKEYANNEADLKLEGFIENLELAQSSGQIEESKENIKEKISIVAHECYQHAVETSNYSFLNNVLNGYSKKIRDDAKVRGRALTEELNKIKSATVINEAKEQRIQQISLMIDEQNYTVAEDLLSRINEDYSDDYEVSRTDYLKKFIDEYDRNYKDVIDLSKKMSDIVSSRIRNKDDKGARKLVDNWMSSGRSIGVDRLTKLLDALGFANVVVKEQTKINNKIDNYVVTTKHPTGVRPNYKHPIAAFGSKGAESGFRVVCLFGKYDADRLIEEFKNISGGRNTIVLLDYALSLNERRRLARKIKSDLGDKVFAVLDRVLLMFLANNYNIQFVNQIMMSTMMPFSYCQPYVWDSSKVMPPEIFVGRKDELEKIESPQGVNIVYGGRQLGKSALLKMAKLNVDNSENSNRAVYIEIKGLDYKKAAKKIGHELYDAGIIKQDIDTEDWDDLARSIKHRLVDTKSGEISYLLLLLDEADTFIESCEEVAFHPLDTLKDIQSVGADRFKFVIAGLHNIVRFKRDAALSNNSVLTHLSSITIKPFTPLEARQLLEEPLYYLGLRFPNYRDIALILANTNYFPGLIQLYCANLIEAMRKNDYAGYSEGDSPIYEVTTKHFKKVLSDPGFTDQVREKFEITLKLDEDNMYYILALLVAYLYHHDSLSANSSGFTSEDVLSTAKGLSIAKVAEQSLEAIEGYMQELKELNIFRQTFDNLYLFSRYSFFQMMGTVDEVEDKLMEYMEE